MTDTLTDNVRNTLLEIMGILYESHLVEDVDMAALLRLMQLPDETVAAYEGCAIAFDDEFFDDYAELTGVDLRPTATMH